MQNGKRTRRMRHRESYAFRLQSGTFLKSSSNMTGIPSLGWLSMATMLNICSLEGISSTQETSLVNHAVSGWLRGVHPCKMGMSMQKEEVLVIQCNFGQGQFTAIRSSADNVPSSVKLQCGQFPCLSITIKQVTHFNIDSVSKN